LGLGEIHLNSGLNEPMNADIDLVAAAPDELTGLKAAIATREAFRRYGIDKPPYLASLSFTVGKGKDGRDALLVRSTASIPEPFVTFLVEVNWARGRLMREYTVLLDPQAYAPGHSPGGGLVALPAMAPAGSAAPMLRRAAAPMRLQAPPAAASDYDAAARPQGGGPPTRIAVGKGDTLSKIARGLKGSGASASDVDQTMIALFRANPSAFGGNINLLREGAVLQVPDADQMAALSAADASSEVHRQMDAWRGGETPSGAAGSRLRLVTPGTGGSATGTGTSTTANSNADDQALKDHVKDLEAQLAESKRLIEIRNNELSALQRKLGAAAAAAAAAPPTAAPPVAAAPAKHPAVNPAPPPAAEPPPSAVEPPPQAAAPPPAAAPAASKPPPAAQQPQAPGSWTDWASENWWIPVGLLAVLVGLGALVAARRRRNDQDDGFGRLLDDPGAAAPLAPSARPAAARKASEPWVEESAARPLPAAAPVPLPAAAPVPPPARLADSPEAKLPVDTLATESPVSLDQGDPLAEADFHMAYGLYDQAADLIRIALEREPERRDLRLKLLEIYFVWGNKEAFLQTAMNLEASRDRAPPGEWDKIVIMGRQICPDEPVFAANAGGGRGAGAMVDLNLEGGENRVDIDLFGDPEGETSTLDHQSAKVVDQATETGRLPGLQGGADHLDFTLDAPERGADDSPTQESAPREMTARDEPTVESELMNFGDVNFLDPLKDVADDAPTTDLSSSLTAEVRERLASRLPSKDDQTAEVSIDDLGLDLGHLEEPGPRGAAPDYTHHPDDAPTLATPLDERSQQLLADADREAHERAMSDLHRELEASFVHGAGAPDARTAVLGPEAAPTVLLSREDSSPTVLLDASDLAARDAAARQDAPVHDPDSTTRLRAINADSIDLDLDRLSTALGGGDTAEQQRADEDLFSSDVFEPTLRNRQVDLDVGDALDFEDSPTARLTAQTNKLQTLDLALPDLEPVTMSEVGTKLDLARAYMDMGDPEGARSILEEVVQEGSASQKQEASRLIESLPG
jgi:pilus assembly protein FimV